MRMMKKISAAGVLAQMTCLGAVDAHPQPALAPAHNPQQYPFYLDLSAAAQLRAAVRYLRDGRDQDIRATREVMVCGGAFHSPHLLMLSGIGDAVSLRALGIQVHKDLPGVGKNLQDHLLQPIFYHSRQELPVPQFIAEAGLFVRTRPGMQAASPNLQFHFGAGLPAFTPPSLGAHFAFVASLVQSLTRGEVNLK